VIALGAALALLPLGLRCTINPATGQSQIALMGEQQEIAIGRENHQQVLRQMSPYADPALQNYVAGLGRELARSSERPSLPWTFTVLDDTAVNAFALPGGFIYVTRGILAHMNSEGELVGVLGHEIGHVTARHSVEQISRAQLANFGLMIGSVLAPELQEIGGLAQQGIGLLLLKYGRDAERQADDLGIRYMTRKGYSADDLAEILGVLGAVGRAQGGGSTPDFLSTHPNPAERVARINAAKRSNPALGNSAPHREDRSSFLSRMQGLPFGPNPREGYFEGDTFYHPDLGVQLDVPRGWQRRNGKESLQVASPDGSAALQVSVAPGGSARAAAQQFFAKQQLEVERSRDITIGGFQALDVPFSAPQQSGERVVGNAIFVQDGRTVYQLLGYGIENRYARSRREVERSLASFTRLRDSCRLNVQPARLEIVRATRGMTVSDLAGGSDVADLQAIAILNHVEPGTPLQPGQAYKRVVSGSRRCRS
jgi:predicted Zn-dependent protease